MNEHIANEAGLLKASINGNSAAFESIVRKYQSLVCAITYSATSNIEKARNWLRKHSSEHGRISNSLTILPVSSHGCAPSPKAPSKITSETRSGI